MSIDSAELKKRIKVALETYVMDGGRALLEELGYTSKKTLNLPSDPLQFWEIIAPGFSGEKALLHRWLSARILFQLTNDEIPGLGNGQTKLDLDNTYQKGMIESFVFLNITLEGTEWKRGDLADITRHVNRAFPMPAIIFFTYGVHASLAVIDRRVNKRDSTRDVLAAKISIIKDICLDDSDNRCPHRAHVEILHDLAIKNLGERHQPSNFRELYEAWIKTLDVKALNRKFYDELLTWYLWAVKSTRFPGGQVLDDKGQPTVAVIRMLTRLIFIWFIKEKGIVPEKLFRTESLRELLKEPPDTHQSSSSYYKAILQNLFFATLNSEPDDRRWKSDSTGQNGHYLIHSVFRYRESFKSPEDAVALFKQVPFLNGGLFECLDRDVADEEIKRNSKLEDLIVKEGNGFVLRVDGFSERSGNVLDVPNKLFFSAGEQIDLNEELGTKNKSRTAHGLIDIFSRYKFTIEENTPVEEEIALDPELLGHVFENLLATYNSDTREIARKQSGSFYTPREIVDYMVDEALAACLANALSVTSDADNYRRLKGLLSYGEETHSFDASEVRKLMGAIENLRVLDPACGSGAFPMGTLQKLVHILAKLDPENEAWCKLNRKEYEERLHAAESSRLIPEKETSIQEAQSALDRFDRDFADPRLRSYTRKLYLIQKCLFGVDIQPIAIQISKLRFFISLVVEQNREQILALPNLETKLVAANALVPLESGQMLLRTQDVIAKEDEIRDANDRYFEARTTRTKRKYRRRIADLRDELAVLLESDGMLDRDKALLASQWDAFDQSNSSPFFDPKWMFGIHDGFDVVIGNPPYIKEFTDKSAFDGLRDSSYYKGKMDLWYIFACQGLDHLRPHSGVLSFIATNNWVTNSGASKFRRVVADRATIIRLLDFMEYKIFGSAAIQTMILIAKNTSEERSYTFDLRRLVNPSAVEGDMQALLKGEQLDGLEYLSPEFERQKFRDTTFTFANDGKEKLLRQISKVDRFLLNGNSEIAQGIVAPQDYVNRKTADELSGVVNQGDGIFNLSSAEFERLRLTEQERALIKPFYTTSELGRYSANKANASWIIYTDSRFKHESAIMPFPNIKRHLDVFRDVITSDNWPYGLHRARDESFFLGKKIVSVRKCAVPTFTYTEFPCYVSQTFNVIQSGRIDLRYLVAVLNSSVVKFWLRQRGKMQGKLFQVDKEPLLSIPILKAPEGVQKVVGLLVEGLIASAGADGKNTKGVLELDQLLNGIVYELYFPEETHGASIRLLQAVEESNLAEWDSMSQEDLPGAVRDFVAKHFRNDASIYRMLFDLQAVPVVRGIEDKE